MARKINVELIDDIDGSEAAETVTFGLDGSTYETDLSDKNASRLRGDLAPFIQAAHRVRSRGRSGRPAVTARATPSVADRERTTAIRAWAASNGYEISTRGRIPASVVEAYETAQRAPAKSTGAPKKARRLKAVDDPAFIAPAV
jgi:hypothetical protein